MLSFDAFETDWGWLGMASRGRGVHGLTLPQQTRDSVLAEIAANFPGGRLGALQDLDDAIEQIRAYFRGCGTTFDVALDLPEQPPFWSRVWDVVAHIPYGSTMSYGQVARAAGASGAARAVGGAMAHNPIPIIVPCHRVLGSGGSLTGFGGGLDMKRRLLAMEAAHKAAAAAHQFGVK